MLGHLVDNAIHQLPLPLASMFRLLFASAPICVCLCIHNASICEDGPIRTLANSRTEVHAGRRTSVPRIHANPRVHESCDVVFVPGCILFQAAFCSKPSVQSRSELFGTRCKLSPFYWVMCVRRFDRLKKTVFYLVAFYWWRLFFNKNRFILDFRLPLKTQNS